MKRKIIIITAALIAIGGAAYADADRTTISSFQNEVVEHGGGCRKSSPPGMCCHMQTSTGIVHCH